MKKGLKFLASVAVIFFITSLNIQADNCDLSGFVTFTQGGWGSPSNSTPGKIRDANFSSVFPSGMLIGGVYTVKFTSAADFANFLPQGGTAGALNQNYINPTSTSSGVLGGQIAALAMNAAYSAAGKLGTNPAKLGDLVIVSGKFAGKTVDQFLSIANSALGGTNTGFTYSEINDAATALNENFDNGTVDKGYLTCGNPKAALGDKVWLDLNKNGIQDSEETGAANVTVKLYDCSTNNLIGTKTTDANGNYLFTELNPGSYKVEFVLPADYQFTVKDAGDDAKDSDADQVSGLTSCYTLVGGQTDLSVDAGIYQTSSQQGNTDLRLTKTASVLNPKDGDQVTYTITVTNYGPSDATGVKVTDLLPNGLTYVSSSASQGSYNQSTGLWTVGNLNNGASASLNITVTVHVSVITTSTFTLGPAADFNLFVLNDLNQPSSDTEGKVAVGHDAKLSNYSVGDKLPNSNGTEDVLIVNNDLHYTSGAVYSGNIVVGGNTNLPIDQVSINNGTLKHGHPIDFAAASSYFNSMTAQLAAYTVTAPTQFIWGGLILTGTDPFRNVFMVDGANLSSANNVEITAPNGSVVVVNVSGTNVSWTGGFTVTGTSTTNVLFNFYEATSLKIQGIDVTGSILAPFADVNFVSGVQNGQMIAKNVHGTGQFNNVKFLGNIPTENSIKNVAEITSADQNDPNSTPGNGIPSENDYASVTVNTVSTTTNPGTSGSKWAQVGNFAAGEVIWTIKAENNNQLLAGSLYGKIYKSIDNGTNWKAINETMQVHSIWSVITKNNSIFAATEQGVFVSENNGDLWVNCGLTGKDVRAIAFDNSGNLYAGTWGAGVFKSSDNGSTWEAANSGLTSMNVDAIAVNAANDIYIGTFGAGVYKLVNRGTAWTNVNMGYNYVWSLGINTDGTVYAGTYGDGVYKSNDNGDSWSRANTNLKARFIYAISFDASSKIYLSAFEGGIFGSADKGNSWKNLGMEGCGASSVAANSNSKMIYVGTNNGAIYQAANTITDVKQAASSAPVKFSLAQNYPNPFNPSTVIGFSVPEKGNYSVKVYNIIGQLVATLVNSQLEAGNYKINFNAGSLSSGVYIYQITGKNTQITKKMLLQK